MHDPAAAEWFRAWMIQERMTMGNSARSDELDDMTRKLLQMMGPEKVMESFTPEQRMVGLSGEERVAGLSDEERLAGMSGEKRLAGLSKAELKRLKRLIDRTVCPTRQGK